MTFTKMQGLGNDFIVIDGVSEPQSITPARVKHMADRRFGIGCDQLLLIEPSTDPSADFIYRIFNADGSEVEQCGNGARCVARYIVDHQLHDQMTVRLLTKGGVISAEVLSDQRVTVSMGRPRIDPKPCQLTFQGQPISLTLVDVGNPHAVLQGNQFDLNELGRWLSTHEQFPCGVNVELMQVMADDHIQLEVYERGVGPTLACGSGACAAMAVAHQNGWVGEKVLVSQPGGDVDVLWLEKQSILLRGPADYVFSGSWLGDHASLT